MEWYQMDAGKCLEFSKKMAVLRKLVRLGLISENEYIRAKNRIMSSYHILESEYFKSGTGKSSYQRSVCQQMKTILSQKIRSIRFQKTEEK